MNKINYASIWLGGLFAGVIINIGQFILNTQLIKHDWQVIVRTFDLPKISGGTLIFFNVMSLILGVVIVWLYAAIRPRFGAGIKTAILAGIIVWFLVWVQGFGGTLLLGIYSIKLVLVISGWGLLLSCLASVIGSKFYKEEIK